MLRWAKPVIYVKSVPDIACQKLSKLANVLPSYSKNKSGTFLLRHTVYNGEQWCKNVVKHFVQMFGVV